MYAMEHLLYNAWSMKKQSETFLEAMEMCFLKSMVRVSWTVKESNVEILKTACRTRKRVKVSQQMTGRIPRSCDEKVKHRRLR